MNTSKLIIDTTDAIAQIAQDNPILDLACGSGRNGLHLLDKGLSVVFADRRQDKLDEIAAALADKPVAELWNIDLEVPGANPLTGRTFSSILVFRYLHRPLMSTLKAAIQPGGLVVYETFTVDQPHYGRPRNPDFLLQPGELENTFRDWQTLHSFEGITNSETSGAPQAIAQIVARKPS